ncbi:hypothetical protein BGW42_005735 [Actinomortierella wolfii]|nr:hypothetical protein BGW42_005735 [Actinomortierella wolfii]
MVHPGVIVAVSFGLVATGVVLYTIFKEEFHGLLESPSSVPGGGRHSQSRRKSDGSNDGDSFEGRTTGRGDPHYGYELRSRQVQSENEKNDEEDDDDKGDEEVERREQELAEKMARLDRKEQLLAEREERLRQQQQQLANSVSTIAVSSSHTSPLSPPSSLDNFQHAQPCSSNSNNSNMVSPSTRDNDIIRQHHPLEESLSSLASVEPSLLSVLSNQADDIQQQHLDDQRNPFEESSIYMDASSSALIRDDSDTYHQQAQTQNQQQQPSSQDYLHHNHHISADVDRDGDEITSPRAGTSSDPEWVDADVDSDMQSNFSDYDDWSSSSARSP